MKAVRFACASILLAVSMQVHAQAALTVLAVKGALEGAIAEFRQALTEATSNLQSLGNSLQANAQNVSLDIDRTLGSKINLTFDRLDAAELRLIEDAQALTVQMRVATMQVIAKAGDEARQTIVDADIVAYNASYSLPCRDAKPRLVASFPARLVAGRSTPVLTLRGNFLRQGNASAKVNGKPSRIVERIDRSMTVEIPADVMQSAGEAEVLVSTEIEGLEEIDRSLWAWGFFGCHERKKLVAQRPLGLTVLEPPIRYSVSGIKKVVYTDFREVSEASQNFSNTGSDRCDDNYRVDRQWCITGPGTLARTAVGVVSANCSSGYEGYVPSGDRCVLVQGKVAGCGADRGPFNTWLGCKGRGWLEYNIQLVRRESILSETAPDGFAVEGTPGQKSFNVSLPPAAGLTAPAYVYTADLQVKQGARVLNTYSISQANPNVGPVRSRTGSEVLSIEVDEQ